MARKKSSNLYGYKHIKKTHKKRPGRHTKKLNKKQKYKKYKGQGKRWLLSYNNLQYQYEREKSNYNG